MKPALIIFISILVFIAVIYAIKKLSPLPALPNIPNSGANDYPFGPGNIPDPGLIPLPTNRPDITTTTAITIPTSTTMQIPTSTTTIPSNTYIISFNGGIDLTQLSTTPKLFSTISNSGVPDIKNNFSNNITLNNDGSLNINNLDLTYNVNIFLTIQSQGISNQSLPTNTSIKIHTGLSYSSNPITPIKDNIDVIQGETQMNIFYSSVNKFTSNKLYFYINYTDNNNFPLTNTEASYNLKISFSKN
jgi:hypothetical protein